MTTRTENSDRDAALLAGYEAPLSRSAWADTSNVIPFPVRLSAAAFEPDWDGEDADCFEPIGVLACRLVGQWSLPRILVWGAPGDLREEVSDPREL